MSADLTMDWYKFSLFFWDRPRNLLSVCSLCFATAIFILVCGVTPLELKLSPRTFHFVENCSVVPSMSISCVFFLFNAMIVNLD